MKELSFEQMEEVQGGKICIICIRGLLDPDFPVEIHFGCCR
jgi:hypothetical protein